MTAQPATDDQTHAANVTEQPMPEIEQAANVIEQAASELELGSFAVSSDEKLAAVADESPDAPLARTTRTTRLVVVTYNIRYAVGSFLITGSLFRRAGLGWPKRRPALVARHISRAARALSDGALMPTADLVALQEADRETLRAGGRHVARELARELRMSFAHAFVRHPRDVAPKTKQWWLDFEETIALDEAGETGVAILSRLPLEAVERVELPASECAWRPRLALAARVPFGARRLQVFNAHIDPHASTAGQLAQHEVMLKRADAVGRDEPTVLLGDFNTLTRESRTATRELLEAHGYASPLPTGTATWRAGLYRLHADWIFVRGARVARWGVARPLGVSDHWPVWAEIVSTEDEAAP
jgi:endonuclease/exonuclease/phosphatase family metal-dependent hydrolase